MTEDHHHAGHQVADEWRAVGELAAALVEGITQRRRRSRQRGGTEGSEEEMTDAALEASIGK